MSEEVEALSRKLDLALAKIDLVLAKQAEASSAGKPSLTQRQFAKLINRSPRTVARLVGAKRIRLERGLVPHCEARKFLS